MENKEFDSIKIGLASPDQIRAWSYGEVTKPETINYRTLKPERDGLYCERIFGPTKDWECHCGKYKRIRYKGKICDKCGVEVTRAKVRRERMGHIELAAPVSHIWYFKGIPSRIGLMLDISPRQLDKVLYFANYIVTDPGFTPLEKKQLLTEREYKEMREKYEDTFEAGMGAEAIQKLLAEIDLDKLSKELREELEHANGQKRVRLLKRLECVESFLESNQRPEWMVMTVIPVIPPDLRPLLQLDGGRFATSDLNDLYRRVINRNNRLKRLLELGAPDIIVRNEKRMLQEAVDALIDNGRRGRPVTGANNRALKSLSDMLKGKQGRFRQNLLGKRVDYSGRSVIVVGPELKMDQCGLPKEMALELFKPFVMKDLVEKGVANNIKSARKMVERAKPEVWDSLETVIKGHPVLLNRAPTLHRLGIQAFNPVLVEGRAIKLHPLACTAFNADFDGDQMAVHLPLGEDACREAKMLMLASGNLLKPSDGAPVTVPTQDMILGSYYLTTVRENDEGAGKVFRDENEALMAYAEHVITLHAPIKVRRTMTIDGVERTGLVDATAGRIIFNNPIPQNLGYVDRTDPEHWLEYEVSFRVTKKTLPEIISRCMTRNGTRKCAKMLDAIKAQGYKYSTLSAISVAVCDAVIPPQKQELIAEADKEIAKVGKLFNRGLISDNERYNKTIDIWQKTTDKVSKALADNLPKDNEIYMMADSGARGSMNQIKQLAGMRGLLANTAGKTIEMPIRANYREGLNILEYFVSARGARKGLADTALRTADSGYLTRRLVDVSQEVIIREEDCHATEGIWVREISEGNSVVESFKERLNGRYSLHDVHDPATGELLVSKEKMMDMFDAEKIVNAGITELEIRSVMTCRAHVGVCAHCYGSNMSNGECVKVGESVGIIAAESIGEPGTQLTMRTFHTGGIASAEDITQGLPRVEELFESRRPKAMAIMSEIAGTVHIDDTKKSRHAEITGTDENGAPVTKSYLIPFGQRLKVMEGDEVAKGALLTEGHAYPQDILAIQGPIATQNYLISEVQKVYRLQGVDINDKHIEVIVRQMMRKVRIEDSGSSDFIMGSIVNRRDVMIKNEEIQARIDAGETDLKLVQASQVLLGITKSSLATDSFLSAASFQETTRVLTEAAIKGKVDPLAGLKENVIIGKLIPAGTGLPEVEEELVQAEIARDAAEAAYDH
ncbi:MAG: DNA-directed RNA polymerase subunit beta' [Gemmiger formicilis]|uniref:DNA-directed RNA polymerase subunit beta' n=1 Tax=Gemmiger formicilis TaxID=745368 RepID=UPI003A3DC61E